MRPLPRQRWAGETWYAEGARMARFVVAVACRNEAFGALRSIWTVFASIALAPTTLVM